MLLEINSGDTAWLLTSAALVLLMTPGLAFFYGGMVRSKGVLNMMMMSFVSMGTVGVAWAVFGYSEAFGNSIGLIGNPLEFAFLDSLVTGNHAVGTVPALAFVVFQGCFAIIAVALLSGAIVGAIAARRKPPPAPRGPSAQRFPDVTFAAQAPANAAKNRGSHP